MAERRVSVKFSAEIQGFKSAMAEAAASTDKVKKASEDASKTSDTHLGKMVQSATKNKDAWEQTGAVVAGFGAAAVAGVGMAIKSYADFDKQMSSVDAATHETASNMNLLREAAIKAGADTAFSAVEAGQGIEELAKAGVSTKDILGGGLSGALSLAAAGALGVGDAAEIAASALTQFKLSGDKVPHLADLLAAGAGKAQGSVKDLGMALNQSGLVAASTGLTIEETTGALAAFASAGLTGSDAGTSFKTMLMSLNPNSVEAASLMDQLGIKAYDAQGKFVGMSEYAGILKNALKGLTDEQRNATLKTIFGSDAVRAANILYQEGAEGINKWEAAVNDAGYAAETAAKMQDNLAGDIEKLGGSLDSVFLKSGSGANDFLRGLAQGAEDVVDAIGQIPAPILSSGAAIAGIVGVAALGAGAFLNLTPKVLDAMQAFDKLAPSGSKARTTLEGVGKAAGTLGALATVATVLGKIAESGYMDKIDTGMGKVAKSLAQVAASAPGASRGLDELFKNKDGGQLINTVDGLDSAIKRTFNKDAGQAFNDWGEGLVNGLTGIKGSSQILADSFKRIDTGLAEMVSSGNATGAARNFDLIKAAADKQGVSLDDLKKKFPEYADALDKAAAEQTTAATSGDKAATAIEGVGTASSGAAPLTKEVSKALEDIGLTADGTVANLDKFTSALINAGLLTLSARDAAGKFDEGLDALKGKIDEVMATQQAHGGVLNENRTDLDLMSEAGRAANDVLTDMTNRGLNAAVAFAKNGESQQAVQGQLVKTYDAMVTTARGFGLGKDEAEALTRSILHIPPGVSVESWMSDQAKKMAEQTTGALNAIDGRIVTVTTVERTIKSIETQVKGGGYADDPSMTALRPGGFTGGRVRDIMGFAEGGIVPGTAPADPTVDNVLAVVNGQPLKVRSGEWIINEGSSRNYDRELAAINAGTFPKMPGFASGGRFGREYSARSLGYAPYSASGTPTSSGPTFGDVIITEQQDPVATWHEFARRAHNLSV